MVLHQHIPIIFIAIESKLQTATRPKNLGRLNIFQGSCFEAPNIAPGGTISTNKGSFVFSKPVNFCYQTNLGAFNQRTRIAAVAQW